MSQTTVNSDSPPARGDNALEQSLYAKRERIYPREVHGLFARLRLTGVAALMGIFYFTPWITWDARQAILFDLPARKFYIFGITFWPQDFIYLALLLIVAALSLFFFTALAGRLWCGYACPQTVWTEVFLWIERKLEGDRSQQMKLDKAPWSGRKLAVKGGKHAIWIVLAAWTGYTFVGYFTPIRELGQSVLSLATGPWETFWIVFYGFATYGNAGWLREQVCIYMCPYARFQSAMFDKNTLIISYDAARGDPRGARKRSTDYKSKGLGDCVDCKICVQVCPTGIDIRNGLQYECIGCAACVDACDDVMEKMGYPKGLVRYTTENAIEGRPARVLRPRVLVYACMLLAVIGTVVGSIVTRIPVGLDVIRDRNSLYRETQDGLVENVYLLKLINMDDVDHVYRLTASGIPGLQLKLDRREVLAPAGAVVEFSARLQADPYDLGSQSTEVRFTLAAAADEAITTTEQARFIGPGSGR
jgi:cytochrome c oxidase accessory protein FixG